MKKIIVFVIGMAPVIAFAQTKPITDVNSLSDKLIGIGNQFTYLLIAIAVIFIIWNVVVYFIRGGEDEGSRKKSGMNIVWGIVGLFIIVSIWGLVNILLNTFSTTPAQTNLPTSELPPQVP